MLVRLKREGRAALATSLPAGEKPRSPPRPRPQSLGAQPLHDVHHLGLVSRGRRSARSPLLGIRPGCVGGGCPAPAPVGGRAITCRPGHPGPCLPPPAVSSSPGLLEVS
jgi:hypothetical protein